MRPTRRQALPGTQFPVAALDQFAKQAIPRWGTNDAATQAAYDAYVDKVCPVEAGGIGERILLPDLGIRGNSHMVMMDRNSDEVASLIDRWLARRGLRK
jgi:hypothetical protein